MELSERDERMLEGEEGEGAQKAMEILVALGNIYGATGMVDIKSAQIAGVSYKNLGDAGLEFLQGWADTGARVRVPSLMNPAGVDIERWKELGISEDFAKKQIELIETYKRMGVTDSCTCTPYLIGNRPEKGDHIAWSESSAVSYANSVLGALTNREGGPSALAAAIAGRTPMYGLHLHENRKATVAVGVECRLATLSDYGALGYLVGKEVKSGIPYFRFKDAKPGPDDLKALGASMAASGAIALYHVEGVTPEALSGGMLPEDVGKYKIESLEEGYNALNSDAREIDFVAIGCPHASLKELAAIGALLKGKTVRSALWITTSRHVKEVAGKTGLLEDITGSGAQVVSDTCMVVAPVEELGYKTMATNAGKAAFYAPSHCGLKVRFGTLEECINAAVSGEWTR